jgi:hypothetical protein
MAPIACAFKTDDDKFLRAEGGGIIARSKAIVARMLADVVDQR